MAVKDKMYKEVQLWKSSGKSKGDFILDKEYSKAKFEYWNSKYNKENIKQQIPTSKKSPSQNPLPFPK